MRKRLPEFKNECEERKFWATANSTEYVHGQSGKRKKLGRLKPSVRAKGLRLPVSIIEALKVLANRRDVLYQSLLRALTPQWKLRPTSDFWHRSNGLERGS